MKFYTGVLRSPYEISLGFKTAGQISSVLVSEGAMVQKGQLLARLDDTDYSLGVEALQIQYDQMKAEVDRMEKLYESRSLSANDWQKARSGLEQLGIQLQMNRNKLGYTYLYAPEKGYVTEVNFSKDEMVDAGTPVFTLIGTSSMEVVLDIPAWMYSRMDKITGIECRVTVNGDEDTIPMRILSVVPEADANQLYTMRLGFQDSYPEQLTAGLNVTVGIKMMADGIQQGTMVIPFHSILDEDGKTIVYVVSEDSTAVPREVDLRLVNEAGGTVYVMGLDESDRVVCEGAEVLAPGDKVKVLSGVSASNTGGLL